MRWEGYIDYEETRRAIDLLQAPGEVFEVRVIGTASRKDILSGYFQSSENPVSMIKDRMQSAAIPFRKSRSPFLCAV